MDGKREVLLLKKRTQTCTPQDNKNRLIAPQLCMNEWCNKLCSSAYHSHAEELF